MSTGKLDAPAHASDWLSEVCDGDLSSSQKAALADWLRESPVHVREFLQAAMTRQDLGKMKIPPEKLEAWINDARSASQEPARIALAGGSRFLGPRNDLSLGASLVRRRLRIWRVAACLGILVLTAEIGLRWEEGRYRTAFGEQRVVTLADGSVIELNTDSALNVQFSSHRRNIHMIRGEAYFRVAHDAARPFVVSTGETSVKAVGTQFNVRINDDLTLVSVIEGTVEIRADAASAQTGVGTDPGVWLTAGEEARATRIGPTASKNRFALAKIARGSAQRSVSWTHGRVEFENTPLVDFLSEFQRYRHLRIVIEDDGIRQFKLTGSFDAQDPESALAYIATLPGIRVDEVDVHTFRIHFDKPSQAPLP